MERRTSARARSDSLLSKIFLIRHHALPQLRFRPTRTEKSQTLSDDRLIFTALLTKTRVKQKKLTKKLSVRDCLPEMSESVLGKQMPCNF